MRVIIFIVFYVNYSLTRGTESCSLNDKDPYDWFATLTPFRFASNGRFEEPRIPNCEPVQIWMMARHATRYPHDDEIPNLEKLPKTRDKIVRFHEKGRGHLCEQHIEDLKRWIILPNVSLSTVDIATEGWREGHELGKIYKDAFPSLLAPCNEEINSENYVFNAKRRTRAEYSMYAFMEGLFGSKTSVEPAPFLEASDVLLPDENCPRWLHSNTNLGTLKRDEFMKSSDYEEMRMNVSQRLGFHVSTDEIRRMQDMCRYETAWIRDHKSPWCGIFSEGEWKILEYLDDITYYYDATRYALKTNSLLSCFPLQDMLESFRKIEDGNTYGEPRATFYFTNAEHLLSLLSKLGIHYRHDSPILRPDNYKQMADRRWRTSFLAPFFSNLLAIFHRCNDSNSSHKVTFHLQQRLVRLMEGCEKGICDWNYLKKTFLKPPGQCMIDCIVKKKG